MDTNKQNQRTVDVVVVGGGHAGAEAAAALSRLGKKTALFALSLDAIALLACNPNIGGTAKGHLVKEIDALGGIMGEVADVATIQTRLLNRGNGPAVHSLRAQVDKHCYHQTIKARLETLPNVELVQGEIVEIGTKDGRVAFVKSAMGETVVCGAVVLATGVYLNAAVITGECKKESGPNGLLGSNGLTACLQNLGLPILRFKTGTPPRVLGKTVNFDKMDIQNGESGTPKFSDATMFAVQNDHPCYLTYTNETTHKIILENLSRAPMYNGAISGTGPRYCPSIEDKVVRFADKTRHQIFVEPEGRNTSEYYVQGLSTSLPADLQEQMVHSIVGLEDAKISRYGYAIEYDCLDPLSLLASLETKAVAGLFAAGQINGSSGYEEAAAQGLVAALNASRYLDGQAPYVFGRDEGYLGVLIDDLVTKGTNEPYRMMTSRAEHRLHLRQDNARFRLTETGRKLGLVTDQQYARFLQKKEERERLFRLLEGETIPKSEVQAICLAAGEPAPEGGARGRDLLKRSGVHFSHLMAHAAAFSNCDGEILEHLEIAYKYEGYLQKQARAIKEAKKLENMPLAKDLNYLAMDGLRIEARQKLDRVRPLSIGQAARISGVTPADITVLLLKTAPPKRGQHD